MPAPRFSRNGPTKIKQPEMIIIPEGEFIMGISNDQVWELYNREEEWAIEWYERDLFRVEQPQHRLHLPAYEIGKYPVTNAEYHLFIWNTGYRVPKGWIGFRHPESQENHPVVGVSKIDALAYCEWLSGETGIKYRLPTEAEWEKAARGDDDRLYPWGSDFDPWRCNTSDSGKRSTTPVGEYAPSGDSPWGLCDMAGNVWEWTASRMKPYPYRPDDGREEPGEGDNWVIRGGAWYYSHKLARCTAREGAVATFASPSLGFRLARSITP